MGTVDDDRLDGCNRVVIRDDIALVANNYAETVASIDLSRPDAPEVLDVAPASEEGPNGLALYGSSLLAGSGRFIDAFEVTPDGSITMTVRIEDPGRFESIGSAHDLELAGPHVYVSAQVTDRLNVYRLPEEFNASP